ncbi:MAG: 3-phosphoshikimate 1-carboxyvinyltransferase [Clostridiales bacterium GWF2_36_10]|nr:MAG: 3-phosphoshikimate 1-carboxyvinyltransferase [Clostridiales bacterium GWF2_36_10]HAN20502.1 3-phosphoshikimate 1-carboxyvinyltransferase [Clostridiales bacterium]
MITRITPSPLSGKINTIPSKSSAHRAFICAALSDSPSLIICEHISKDIEATINCLNALGAKITDNIGTYNITPIKKGSITSQAQLDCGESGSTLRFILPIISALDRNAVIQGSGRLPERPLLPLTDQLTLHGAKIGSTFPLECSGKLESGHFCIAGNISSQFISGLLLAAPILGGDCTIELTTKTESKPYIDMTVDVMNSYGVKVETRENGYFVKGGQRYSPPSRFKVEGDWSNSAFWLSCGALKGNGIKCVNLSTISFQGDKAITVILASFGAKVELSNNNVSVAPEPLKGIEINATDIPDLVPVLAVVACGAVGTTKIYNAARLRLKESDRLLAVTNVLTNLGADITQTEDGLVINGTGKLNGGRADAMGDHRIAMSLAVAAIICENEVVIDNAEAINKSYPAYFADYRKLGGKISIVKN